ncbi:hypothetical protein M885DRAFT_623762 [Pelagophyceae sp. CCMP2097]|nr:hypothetical protein M885DRAFT_623762 [Pelagophyceae sp. CCMP2097]
MPPFRPSQKEEMRTLVADDINRACLRVCVVALVAYTALVVFTFIVFAENRAYLQPEERAVAAFAATALTTSFALRMITHISQTFIPDADTARSRGTSGVLCLCHCVNAIATATSWIFVLLPVPTLEDAFTGCRVHMLRWCEWTVLAFVMTFMTDMADKNNAWTAVALASSQAASTFCGYLLPLCAGTLAWAAVMTFSFVFFAALAPKWLQRRRLFHEARAHAAKTFRDSAAHGEAASLSGRIAMSFYLLSACCVVWSGFVAVYFLTATVRFLGLKTSEAPVWPFALDACIDVAAKLVYAAIIVDMHGALYDSERQRSERRFKELTSVIAVVWSASSDALAVSVRHDDSGGGYVETAVSPTANALLAHAAVAAGASPQWNTPPDESQPGESADVLAVRFTYRDGEPAGPIMRSRELWESSIHNRGDVPGGDATPDGQPSAAEASGFAELIRRAWLLEPAADGVLRLTHDLVRANGAQMHVEARVTRIGSWRLVVVVRDITERIKVFEAEKALVKQATAHERDAAANRFTRHEVKNGLLSAIGVVEAMQELSDAPAALVAPVSPGGPGGASCGDPALRGATDGALARYVGDLQATLTETLNSVLSETMARELVYDSYEPVPEIVDVVALLKGHATGAAGVQSSRFKIETWPAEIPFLVLDPQLLHCIHRNAVSNASKYGDPVGEIVTRLRLVRPDGTNASAAELSGTSAVGCAYTLMLELFNEPGPDHERLLDATGVALHGRVFAQGQRLHPDLRCANAAASTVSSGDGGWIMRKCARALGGDCHIEFNTEGTVLTMTCPTAVASVAVDLFRRRALSSSSSSDGAPEAPTSAESFSLPPGTWGIAIDDSKMQRKLLTRLLEFAGVEPNRIKVTGETCAEIHDFSESVAQHVRDHAEDFHLVIVDENLDVVIAGNRTTVLGSECVVRLRATLDAEGLGSKLLTVVRSANDSAQDMAIYRKRAHGFLPKAPVKRDKVLETLQPIWTQRFPGAQANHLEENDAEIREELPLAMLARDSFDMGSPETSRPPQPPDGPALQVKKNM